MQKIKLLPFVAIMTAIGFSAFDHPAKKIQAEDPLWFYTESTADDHGDPTKYIPLDGEDEEALCPGQSLVRCVIEAPDSSGYPMLSSIVQVVSRKP